MQDYNVSNSIRDRVTLWRMGNREYSLRCVRLRKRGNWDREDARGLATATLSGIGIGKTLADSLPLRYRELGIGNWELGIGNRRSRKLLRARQS